MRTTELIFKNGQSVIVSSYQLVKVFEDLEHDETILVIKGLPILEKKGDTECN
ncbi:hypothetical protein PSA85_03675 [Limosilactobacillus reuteri]|uniref:hypothetical protein n=1 Tax=Limosilactobacillus reuteri TaxID=1598 RepID=UPI001785B519|nr:hypothetical protein [Limosilactobacillus reuteri]MCC4515283.1 hypothetical protein [Limosilactobacillus reuteri]MDD1406485.1 hypothetical protein [Limosilactobacillus reuteri]